MNTEKSRFLLTIDFSRANIKTLTCNHSFYFVQNRRKKKVIRYFLVEIILEKVYTYYVSFCIKYSVREMAKET